MEQPLPDIEELLFKQLQGSLTATEKLLLDAWIAQNEGNNELAARLSDPARLTKKLQFYAAHRQEEARNEAIRHLFPQRRTVPIARWWVAAAVFLFMAGTLLWFYNARENKPARVAVVPAGIVPGRQGAILTLADGSQVLLDTIKNGVVALQGGVTATIINGSLHYEGVAGAGMAYNTMSTPKGRLFQLVLPDGTQVWLNSGSSIRYPLAFNSATRRVEITGEAYFEVAANASMPFVVAINKKAEVQVLGTHFNVNAYDNEQDIAATLLEGAVQVVRLDAGNNATPVALQPGEQARWRTDATAGISVVKSADIAKVMAWKNGLFNFEGASLEEVMRQLERWYDIEVVFEKPMGDIRFGGKMTKGMTLNDVLDALKGFEGADLKFRMEGERKLVVSR